MQIYLSQGSSDFVISDSVSICDSEDPAWILAFALSAIVIVGIIVVSAVSLSLELVDFPSFEEVLTLASFSIFCVSCLIMLSLAISIPTV